MNQIEQMREKKSETLPNIARGAQRKITHKIDTFGILFMFELASIFTQQNKRFFISFVLGLSLLMRALNQSQFHSIGFAGDSLPSSLFSSRLASSILICPLLASSDLFFLFI